ncbi:TolC family protein [Planctomycetota bacterium]
MFAVVRITIRYFFIALCALWCISALSGCKTKEEYKIQADKEVYSIIDNKWSDEFGEKVNYTVSDVEPSPNDIRLDVPAAKTGIISLAEAVAIATASNREYQTQKEELYFQALDLTLVRHDFARQWFGTIDGKYLKEGEGRNSSGDREEQLNADTELGFEQLLADGAFITTSIAVDWARFLTGDPRTTLASVLRTTVTVPLLRGSSRDVVQEQLTQAERNALYQIRTFNRFRKTFVVTIVSGYYRVLQQNNVVTNAWNNYQRRVELRKRSEKEAETGRTPWFEVDQAEQRELDARDRFISEEQRYKQRLDEFKILLALPTDADVDLDSNELKALEEIGISQPEYSQEMAVETGLLGRLDLANSADRVEDAVRKIVVAIDGLDGGLNLVGGLNVASAGKTNYGKLEFERGIYSLGVESDLPLDRKEERNIYRESLILLEQIRRDYQEAEDRVKLQVRQSYRELDEAAKLYKIRKIGLELARKRVESMPMLLKTGRAKTRDVLESQDALIEAENALTAALVDHTIAKLNFFSDIGVLQVAPDGMWK